MSQQSEIARGINKLSRSKVIKIKGRFKHFGKGGAKKAAPEEPKEKLAKFYPAEDTHKPLNRNFKPKAAKLRKSISPGTVLIVLSGRFRGKRVVFLKQLDSGLLLVTGPYTINGVPLRRLNQAYVIATSTQVNVSGADVSAVNDNFFARQADAAPSREDAFSKATHKAIVSDARKAAQGPVDAAIEAAINGTPLLREYLKAKFSLRSGQFPHKLRF
jgi:large subunit ribosomal protein L6e